MADTILTTINIDGQTFVPWADYAAERAAREAWQAHHREVADKLTATAVALEQAEAALEAMRGRVTWQPVATAPRDGSLIWLADAGSMRVSFWHQAESRWIDFHAAGAGEAVRGLRFEPTHWMPCPSIDELRALVGGAEVEG